MEEQETRTKVEQILTDASIEAANRLRSEISNEDSKIAIDASIKVLNRKGHCEKTEPQKGPSINISFQALTDNMRTVKELFNAEEKTISIETNQPLIENPNNLQGSSESGESD